MQLKPQQTGMILAVVLVFLLILSLLAASALSTSYLQMQMSYNFSEEAKLLQAAEAGLRAAENKLIVGDYQFNFYDINVAYSIKQLTDTHCVLDENNNKTVGIYYSLTSKAGLHGKEEIVLQGTYLKPTTQKCTDDKEKPLHAGRLSWRQF